MLVYRSAFQIGIKNYVLQIALMPRRFFSGFLLPFPLFDVAALRGARNS